MNDETYDDDDIGYGNPPMHSRFTRGQSGNPKGRPKSARGLKAAILELLDSEIETMDQDGRLIKKTVCECIIEKIISEAAMGSIPHMKLLCKYSYVDETGPIRIRM